MNAFNRRLILFICLGAGVLLTFSLAEAAEGAGSGRKLWDNIMLWVNFGILVFLFMKFAKKPLMDFLRGQKDKIELNLKDLEGQLREKRTAMEAEVAKLANIDARIAEIRQRLMEIGQREKERLIQQAKEQAQRMLEKAELESKSMVASAKKQLNAELAEIAIELVHERIRKGFSSEDQDRLIEDFMTGLKGQRRHVRSLI